MAHESIAVYNTGDIIGVFSNSSGSVNKTVAKISGGFAVAGYYTYNEGNDVLVGVILAGGSTTQAVYMYSDHDETEFIYNGEKLYYQNRTNVLYNNQPANPPKTKGKAHYLGHYDTLPLDASIIATELLNYYYSGDDEEDTGGSSGSGSEENAPPTDFQNGFALAMALFSQIE